ncbi:dTMP kinase [Pontiellaceae bacterium B12227]|nr:dTMP kinase [Pontiellaceae bacterium B12227]
MPGKFITFEGPEGSGKSTQIRLLVEKLEEQGIEITCTREPGGTATGEQIRNLLQHDAAGEPLCDRAELLLFTASRAQLMDRVILPALGNGGWVLCDRFIDSTMAYQGFARGMDIATLDAVNEFAIYERKPDLTLLLDLDIEAGFRRLEERYADSDESHDRFEQEARDFHHKVRDGYHQLAEREPNRFCIINADRFIEEVAEDIWNAVKGALL